MNPQTVAHGGRFDLSKAIETSPSFLARRLHSIFQQSAVASLSEVSAVYKDGVLNFTVANRALQEPDAMGHHLARAARPASNRAWKIRVLLTGFEQQ